MAGRPKKEYEKLRRPIHVEMPNQYRFLLAWIVVTCPACGSWLVGTNGTRRRKGTRVEGFQCKNPACPHLARAKAGKNFVLATSGGFRAGVVGKLGQLYEDLFVHGAKGVTVARKYHVSPSQVSALRARVEDALDATRGLANLVATLQPDAAVAIDETFLTVHGKTIYLIIATGYETHKTLGLRVSETRKEADLRAVFDEADRNTSAPITVVTSDAWGATQAMVKRVGRELTHVIHRHKKPYTEAVIRHVTYEGGKRVITDVGVKTDVFKREATREFRCRVKREALPTPAPKKNAGAPRA